MLVITERKQLGKKNLAGGMEGDDSFTNIPGTQGNLKSLKQHYCEAVNRGRRAAADGEPSSKGQTDGLTIESRARGSGACFGKMRVGE